MKKMFVLISFIVLTLGVYAVDLNMEKLPEIAIEEAKIKEYTKQEILEILEKGVEEWNNFRNENPEVEIKDYLSGLDLRKKDLSGINFSEIDLKNTLFMSANLENSNFYKADCTGANFFNANLNNSNLEEAILLHVNLDKTSMYRANMNNTIVSKIWKSRIKNKKILNLTNISWR